MAVPASRLAIVVAAVRRKAAAMRQHRTRVAERGKWGRKEQGERPEKFHVYFPQSRDDKSPYDASPSPLTHDEDRKMLIAWDRSGRLQERFSCCWR